MALAVATTLVAAAGQQQQTHANTGPTHACAHQHGALHTHPLTWHAQGDFRYQPLLMHRGATSIQRAHNGPSTFLEVFKVEDLTGGAWRGGCSAGNLAATLQCSMCRWRRLRMLLA